MTTPAAAPGVCAIWTSSPAVTGSFATVEKAVTEGKLTSPQIDLAVQQACDILYTLSGRQFPGVCEKTFRPMARPISWSISEWVAYFQAMTGNMDPGAGWGTCWGGQHDMCRHPPEIDLGVYPIRQVMQVKIDGTVIPANEYRIDEHRLIVRVRPTADYTPTVRWGWPTCQNLELPDTEVSTFSIDAQFGMDPPASGVAAANALASQLALAHANEPNKLPSRLTTITRQGVSMAVVDPMAFLDAGLTGVYEADLFIRAMNPSRQRKKPKVYSRDTGYSRS